MNITSKIYLLKDSFGNEAYDVAEDGSNSVQICGLFDKDGNPVYFESEAYHLDRWSRDYGIELRILERNDDFETTWDSLKTT